ncbi:MAG: PAS domain S-box protein [Cyanobacteria bacterium P01_G01_bin.54]
MSSCSAESVRLPDPQATSQQCHVLWLGRDRHLIHLTQLQTQLQATWQFYSVQTLVAAQQITQSQTIDVVVLALPEAALWSAVQTDWLRQFACLVCLADDNTELGLSLLQAGVQDYLLASECNAQQLQRRLQAAQVRFKAMAHRQTTPANALLSALPTVFFQCDRQSRLSFLNPAWERLIGIPRAETLGTLLTDYIYPSDRPAFDAACQTLLDSPSAGSQKCWIRLFELTGRCRWCEICLTLEQDEQQQAIGFLGQIYDQTEHHQQQQNLRLSERFWRSYFESSLVAISIISTENTYLQVNPAFCALLGYARPELMHRCWFDLTHPDDLDTDMQLYQQLCTGQINTYTLDKRYICKDDRVIYVRQSVSGMWNDANELEQITCTLLDLSDKYAAEAALSRSEERLRLALTGSGLALWDWNLTLNEVYLSAEWNTMLGYTDEPLSGPWQLWEHLIHPDELELVWQRLQQHFRGEKPFFEVEYRLLTQTGTWKWILARGRVFERDQLQNPLRMTGTHQDISDRKDIAQMKNEFISIVSHELRTPLTSIYAALRLFKTGCFGQLNDRGQETLAIALRNTQHLTQLINDILDLDRLERGTSHIQKQWCDTQDLVNQAIETMRSTAQDREVGLDVIYNPTLVQHQGTRIWADAVQIVQVLSNLLSNAIKFSPPDSTVTIVLRANAKAVLFEVHDYGRGIPTDKLESIFERFKQVDASDTREKGGTGLGLTICRQIVEQHGGQIWAESVFGCGSLLSFTIPNTQTLTSVERV